MILYENVGKRCMLNLPWKAPVRQILFMTSSACSSWERWLFYSVFLLLSEGSIKAQIYFWEYISNDKCTLLLQKMWIHTKVERIVRWTDTWSLLCSFNKHLMSDLVSSSLLSIIVPTWNYFQGNLRHCMRTKTSNLGIEFQTRLHRLLLPAPPMSCLLLGKWPHMVKAPPLDLHRHEQ